MAADAPLREAGLTSKKVENWVEYVHGVKFICFRAETGELFHFRQAELKRGRPTMPYRSIEELTRPVEMLTVANCASIAGVPLTTAQSWVWGKKIPSVTKAWRFGSAKRHGCLVKLEDLKSFLVKRELKKAAGHGVIMDITEREVLAKINES